MKKIIMLIAAVVGSFSLIAQTTYQKVTTSPEDWTGTYLIVCESQSVVFNGAADEANIDAKGGAAIIAGVTINDGTITGTNTLNAATFTISATDDVDWPWAIQSASGLYIGHKDTTIVDNGLSAENELKKKCKHTLSLDESGNLIAVPRYGVDIVGSAGAFNLQYNKKTEQQRFRYFVPGGQKAVQLYKQMDNATGTDQRTSSEVRVKSYENGQLIIRQGDKKYSILGSRL